MKNMTRVIVSFEEKSVKAQKVNMVRELLFRNGLNQSRNNVNLYVRKTDDPEELESRVNEVLKEFPSLEWRVQQYVS